MTNEQFTQLAAQYIDTVFRVAFSFLKHKAEAEDVTQNVMLKLYRQSKPFASTDHVKHWLIRVTLNECKKTVRSPRWGMDDISDYANTLSFTTPEHSELFYAVMDLPQKYRVPIFLYYYEDYSTAEISKLMGIPTPTVVTRLHRGRGILKSKLQEAEHHA